MDANSLKNCDIKLLVLSRGRASTIRKDTCANVPEWVPVLVPESQEAEYRKAISNPLEFIPDGIVGLSAVRNWVMRNYQEHSIVMLDDDISRVYNSEGRSVRKLTPDEVAHVLVNAAVMTRDADIWAFTFARLSNIGYKACDPFKLTSLVTTVCGINGRHIAFPDEQLKGDVDFSLENFLARRIIWSDDRYIFANKRSNNSGGNAGLRSQEKVDEAIAFLKKKWGPCITAGSYKRGEKINGNVQRRQQLTYNH